MNLFIACSSSDDMALDTLEEAGKVIQNLSSCGDYDLIIGGNTGGLMKFCYNAFHDQERLITGIVASRYQSDLEQMDCDLSMVTETTFDRSKEIVRQADAMLFMPGGIGTMAEFFGMLEEVRTYSMNKPMILYNESHSFDPLIHLLDSLKKDELVKKEDFKYFQVVKDQEELFSLLEKIQKKQEHKIR